MSDIAFAANLLARHNATPTKHHWTCVKHILRYENGTRSLRLFSKESQILIWLDTLTLDIYLIPTMVVYEHALCFKQQNNYFVEVFQINFSVHIHKIIVRQLHFTRPYVNVSSFIEWLTTSNSLMVLMSLTHQPLYMKIIWLVLHRSRHVTSKAMSLSIFLPNCYILMNFNRKEK